MLRMKQAIREKIVRMKIWKLVSGIISIVLFVFVTFQSCAAGVANTLLENGQSSGTAGIFVAIMLLVGGIVSIAVRNTKIGGDIALIILFALGAIIGFSMAGIYLDLYIWASWSALCAILAIVSIVLNRRKTA